MIMHKFQCRFGDLVASVAKLDMPDALHSHAQRHFDGQTPGEYEPDELVAVLIFQDDNGSETITLSHDPAVIARRMREAEERQAG